MLIKHRIDDVNKRFVTRKNPVSTGQQISFEPALALMLAEHFHDPAVGGNVIVEGKYFGGGFASGDVEQSSESVGHGFVGAEYAEVLRGGVQFQHISQKLSLNFCRLPFHSTGFGNFDGVVR